MEPSHGRFVNIDERPPALEERSAAPETDESPEAKFLSRETDDSEEVVTVSLASRLSIRSFKVTPLSELLISVDDEKRELTIQDLLTLEVEDVVYEAKQQHPRLIELLNRETSLAHIRNFVNNEGKDFTPQTWKAFLENKSLSNEAKKVYEQQCRAVNFSCELVALAAHSNVYNQTNFETILNFLFSYITDKDRPLLSHIACILRVFVTYAPEKVVDFLIRNFAEAVSFIESIVNKLDNEEVGNFLSSFVWLLIPVSARGKVLEPPHQSRLHAATVFNEWMERGKFFEQIIDCILQKEAAALNGLQVLQEVVHTLSRCRHCKLPPPSIVHHFNAPPFLQKLLPFILNPKQDTKVMMAGVVLLIELVKYDTASKLPTTPTSAPTPKPNESTPKPDPTLQTVSPLKTDNESKTDALPKTDNTQQLVTKIDDTSPSPLSSDSVAQSEDNLQTVKIPIAQLQTPLLGPQQIEEPSNVIENTPSMADSPNSDDFSVQPLVDSGTETGAPLEKAESRPDKPPVDVEKIEDSKANEAQIPTLFLPLFSEITNYLSLIIEKLKETLMEGETKRFRLIHLRLVGLCSRLSAHAAVRADARHLLPAFSRLNFWKLALDLLFMHPWMNILHVIVQKICERILLESDDLELKTHLVIECGLVDRIVEADRANQEDCQRGGGGQRRGYMGTLTVISKAITEAALSHPALQAFLEGREGWQRYVKGALATTRQTLEREDSLFRPPLTKEERAAAAVAAAAARTSALPAIENS